MDCDGIGIPSGRKGQRTADRRYPKCFGSSREDKLNYSLKHLFINSNSKARDANEEKDFEKSPEALKSETN